MSLARLIRYKLLMVLRGFTRGPRRRRIARLAGTGGIAAAVGALAAVAYELFVALTTIGAAGEQASATIVAMTFHAILLLAFVFDIATTANIFFLSSDLGLLMATPLRTTRIFALKYLEAIVAVSFVALMIGLPVVLGYGAGLGAPPVFYPVAIAAMLVFLSIPVSVGTICGMLISRFVRAGRVRELLAVFGGVIGLAVWLVFQTLRPGEEIREIQDITSRVNALASGGAGLLDVLPSRLPAEVITAMVSADWAAALPPAVILLAVSGVMFAVSLVLAERIYVTGWTRAVPAAGKRRKRVGRPGRGRRTARLLRWLPPAERTIFETASRLILRDPQQLTPIATITVIMALFPFFVGQSGRAAMRPAILLYSISMLTFTGSMNLATSAIMIHGRSFWHLLLAPASSVKRLGAHLAVSAAFFTAVGAALAAAFGFAGLLDWVWAAKAVWLAACFAPVGSSAGILMALCFGDWEWDTPKRMLRMGGRLVSVGLVLGLFAVLGLVLGSFSGHPGQPGQAGAPVSSNLPWRALLAVAASAALLTGLLVTASVARMSRLEWRA